VSPTNPDKIDVYRKTVTEAAGRNRCSGGLAGSAIRPSSTRFRSTQRDVLILTMIVLVAR